MMDTHLPASLPVVAAGGKSIYGAPLAGTEDGFELFRVLIRGEKPERDTALASWLCAGVRPAAYPLPG